MENPIRKWTEKLEGKWEMILVSFCEVIIGILLLVRPLRFTAGIIVAAGVLCILLGLKYGVSYFRMDIIRASTQRDLFRCLVFVGGGLFLVFGSGWLSSTQVILNIVYGVALLILSAEKIQWAVNLLRWQKPYWYVTGISAVLTVVVAILMLLNPFPKQIIWIVIGISLVAEAVLDLIALFFSGKKTKVHAVGSTVSTDAPKEKTVKEKSKKKASADEKNVTKEEITSGELDQLGSSVEEIKQESAEEKTVEKQNTEDKQSVEENESQVG